MFKEFISSYGLQIITTVAVSIGGYISFKIKKLCDRYVDNQIKKDVIKTSVNAVEQLYKDIHGDEKKHQAMIYASKVLWQYGIEISEQELGLIVESVVNEINKDKESK